MENTILHIGNDTFAIATNNMFLGICILMIVGVITYKWGQTLLGFRHKKSIEK